MKKPIYEYEFKITRHGKKETVQQSETTQKKAEARIKRSLKGVTDMKFKRKFKYPHLEGGKKA